MYDSTAQITESFSDWKLDVICFCYRRRVASGKLGLVHDFTFLESDGQAKPACGCYGAVEQVLCFLYRVCHQGTVTTEGT